jgi:MoaA/NifB/PqqE/SkfB family radical SAM enzyme
MTTAIGASGDLGGYHAARAIAHQPFRSACYAPFVGLSFDITGAVSVCAFTRATPLGRIGELPLIEMWKGRRINELRDAVERDDLQHACSRCAEEIAGGNLHGVLAAGFDQFPARRQPDWPTRMEFALSNTCNLQCVMCSGEFSSAIRSQREGLPPVPNRYGQDFLDELEPFLPHLQQARFLGGEPFLAEVNFRIWERMIDLGVATECNVTTNGTCWTPRVERVLDRLPFSIGVSIDGVTQRTVERVRAGASHRQIMDNLQRFVRYRDRTGASLSLTFCLMVDNWHEFADYLVMGEELGCQVYVNTVRQPPVHSLYHLPGDQLDQVVRGLERDLERVGGRLEMNRLPLIEHLERLRQHGAERAEEELTFASGAADRGRYHRLAEQLCSELSSESEVIDALREASSDGQVHVLRCDADDRLVEGTDYMGIPVQPLLGSPASRLFPMLAERFGHRADVLAEQVGPGVTARIVSFRSDGRSPTVMVSMTRRGEAAGTTTRIAALLARGGASATPVDLERR